MKMRNIEQPVSFWCAARQAAATLLAVSLALPLAQAQQQPQQAGTQQFVAKSPGKALARTPDIISDNLDRVAASADQILEVLRSEEHTSELQSRGHLVCRLLLEKKKKLQSRFDIV